MAGGGSEREEAEKSMSKKHKFMALLLIVTILFCLAGCDGKSDMQLKKELNIQLTGSPTTIDPQCVSDTGSSFVVAFFVSTLYEYTADNRLVPGLAESRDLSDDNLTITYHLKKGICWSDGSPITAEDFVYAFQRLADPEIGSNSVYFITDCCRLKNADGVTTGELPVSELGVSAPDLETFVIELEESCPYLDSLLTFPVFAPCKRSFCASCGKEYATSPETMLYSGPFVLDRYEPLATQIHLVPNPYYHNEGRPALPGVNLQVVADAQQAAMCYQNGILDVITITGEITDLALDDPQLKRFPTAGMQYICFNPTECPALSNRNIRMALSKSIDRDSISKNVLRLGYSTLTRVSPPGYYFETDGSDFSKDEDRYNEYTAFNAAAAKAAWQEGLKELGISSLKLNFCYNATTGTEAEAIKAQMENCLPGLEIELKPLTRKEYLNMSSAGAGYDIFMGGWVGDYQDPTTFFYLYVNGGKGMMYRSEEFDELISLSGSVEAVKDPDMRNGLLHDAEDILMEGICVIPLFTYEDAYLVRAGVNNFVLTATSAVIPAWIEKEVTQ